jgi:hypothetical protein
MNQEKMDQGWQQLQSRIDNLVSRFLKNDFPALEYKSHNLALLQLPPKYKGEEIENI